MTSKKSRMKKISFTKCKKYKKFKKSKMSYICDIALRLSNICHKCGSEGVKIFKEK